MFGTYEVTLQFSGASCVLPHEKAREWAILQVMKNPREQATLQPVNVIKRHWRRDVIVHDTLRMTYKAYFPEGGDEALVVTVDQYRRFHSLKIGTPVISLNNEAPYARRATLQGFCTIKEDVFPLVSYADQEDSFISFATLLHITPNTVKLLTDPEEAKRVWYTGMMLQATRI